MSLLLDAQKKMQQAQSGSGAHSGLELTLEPHPDAPPSATAAPPATGDHARVTGQNLFNAKSGTTSLSRPGGLNRNWMIFLGGTVLFLAAGAGYVWHAISPGNAQLARPVSTQPLPPSQPELAMVAQSDLVPGVAQDKTPPAKAERSSAPRHTKRHVARTHSTATNTNHSVIELRHEQPIDPLLNDAYIAYRDGKLEQAQQSYLKVVDLDADNTDALLGLAAIAQRRGEDNTAAHYYAQVLALDPRNAVANAGMSALTNDDNRESRLKILLDEQPNSSSLHFALGNYYAEQARWSEAQQSYFNAYKLAPGNAELAFNLAVSLDQLGENKLATQYYQRALQLDTGLRAGFDHAKISQRIEVLTH